MFQAHLKPRRLISRRVNAAMARPHQAEASLDLRKLLPPLAQAPSRMPKDASLRLNLAESMKAHGHQSKRFEKHLIKEAQLKASSLFEVIFTTFSSGSERSLPSTHLSI